MSEQAFLAAGAVFVGVVTVAILRLGARTGGRAWAAAWVCLVLSGLGTLASEQWPETRASYPIFGTVFAALLWVGARRFAGREVPRLVLPLVVLVIAIRVGLQPYVSDAVTQLTASGLISLAALAAAWEVGRTARSPEGSSIDAMLAASFPLLAVATWIYAWSRAAGTPANGMFIFLLAGILVAGMQIGALLAHVTLAAERGRAALATLFDTVPIGLLLSDAHGRVKVTNRVMAGMVGDEPADSWKRRPVRSLMELLGASNANGLEGASRLEDLHAGACEEELRLPNECVIEAHGRTVHAEDGTIVGRLILTRDVTSERRMQEQLQRTGRLETLGRLAGGIAHDFNNKLTTVIGNAALVRSSLPPGHPQHAPLADLESAANDCADLTRDLLDFAKRSPRSARSLALEPFLDELVGGLTLRLGGGVEIDIEVQPNVGQVRADPTQLERVVTNLLMNARDAVPTGGRVRLAASRIHRAQREQIAISISDDGSGMDEETRQRIFDPYFSTKANETAATGLGLAIVHGIVTSHEGEIHVESLPGQGTRVVTTWPAA